MLSTPELVETFLFAVALGGSLLGNSLLFSVLCFAKRLPHSASPNLVFNSALTDFLNALVNIPLALDYIIFRTGNLDVGFTPVLVNSMITFFLLLTLHSTLAMMADKLLILKYPVFYHNKCTVKKARIVCVFQWLSAALTTLVVYGVREMRTPKKYSTLIEYMTINHRGNGKFFAFATTFSVLLLLVLVCGRTYLELRAAAKKKLELEKPSEEVQGNSSANIRNDLRPKLEIEKNSYACRTVLIIVVVYMVSFLPITFNSLLRMLDVTPLDYNREQIFVPIFCSHFGALCNPLIFILRSNNYRKAARTILRGLFPCCTQVNKIIDQSFRVQTIMNSSHPHNV